MIISVGFKIQYTVNNSEKNDINNFEHTPRERIRRSII